MDTEGKAEWDIEGKKEGTTVLGDLWMGIMGFG
jgi:hypothetical protein